MARPKKSAANKLAADLKDYEQSRTNSGLNSIDKLVQCCLIPNDKARKKAVAEIVAADVELRKLMDGNPKLLQAEVERTLLKLVTGYEITDVTKRISNGRVFTETRTRHIAPNQRAIEYWLNNRAADKWSSSPSTDDDEALSKLDEILRGVQANAADSKTK